MVYNIHERKDPVSNVIKSDGRGNRDSHFKTKDDNQQFVIDPINSFPVVDSQYCQAKANKKYKYRTWFEYQKNILPL